MTRQYAIFYSRDYKTMKLDLSQPFGIVELAENQITLTGEKTFVKNWRPYFSSNPAWLKYLQTDRPLATMASKTSMGQMIPYDENTPTDPLETAKAALQGEIITETFTPQAPKQ